jgi:hypothetical protein
MSKLKITKAFVNVTVNIVGEYSGISEAIAQDYLERMDDINCVLASSGFDAITEPDHVIEWSSEDAERNYIQKLPVQYIKYLVRAYATFRQVRDTDSHSVLSPRFRVRLTCNVHKQLTDTGASYSLRPRFVAQSGEHWV